MAKLSADPSNTPLQRPLRVGVWNVWFNQAFRYWAWQLVVVVVVISGAGWLIGNAQSALGRLGVATGFSFLFERAGFDIGESPIPFSSSDSFLKAYAVGLLNTMTVSLVGIVLATLIGAVVGLARVSANALMRGLASTYVELFRNTPQLVQLIFWYAVITRLPAPGQAISFGEALFLSNRGLVFPWPSASDAFAWVVLAFLVGCVAAIVLRMWARRRYSRTGRSVPALRTISLALMLIAPVGTWFLFNAPTGFSVPQLQGFNFRGGMTVSPEFLAMLLALSLYIGAFIAEIVRTGIRSIGKGQIEAARAIGLSSWQRYSRIVLPQALRVMIPPATAQYVSLIKNSSLGVAIGYPELFNINNSIITLSGRTIEAIGIMMAVYLSISLAVAALMNAYNRHAQITER
jgi:general L-amino acid transport system permease protein